MTFGRGGETQRNGMSIHQLIQDSAFDPETIAIMGRAYETARARLGPDQPRPVLETVAKRILEAARRGERDHDKLTAVALRGLDGAGRHG